MENIKEIKRKIRVINKIIKGDNYQELKKCDDIALALSSKKRKDFIDFINTKLSRKHKSAIVNLCREFHKKVWGTDVRVPNNRFKINYDIGFFLEKIDNELTRLKNWEQV